LEGKALSEADTRAFGSIQPALPVDQLNRNELITSYLPLVKSVAERFRTELPPSVETDDLVSAGVFGLMDAIDRFDPSLGVKFTTFCTTRLRGAMIDELRALDGVPRAVRLRARSIEESYRTLQERLGRAPTDDELADATGMAVPEMMTIQVQAAGSGPVSLAQTNAQGDELADWALGVLQDKKVPEPSDVLHREEVRKLIRSVVHSLPRLERLVLILYYYEQLTMKQVGEVMSLSESRVCQIHSDVIRRLQLRLKAYKADFFGPAS